MRGLRERGGRIDARVCWLLAALATLAAPASAMPADDHERRRAPALYFGDLHNHSKFSDGSRTVDELITQAREAGLSVLALSDHAEYLSVPFNEDLVTSPYDPGSREPHLKWQETLASTERATQPDFVAIRGFEWSSHTEGHVNVWWSEQYTDSFRTPGTTMRPLWQWLDTPAPIGGADGVAGFNHPGPKDGPLVFDDFAYSPAMDKRFATIELFNEISRRHNKWPADYYERYYVQALDKGWHVGAIGVSDNHGRGGYANLNFPRTGIWVFALTPAGVREAIEARRVYATEDHNLELRLTGNGRWMGSRLTLDRGDRLRLRAQASDPDPGDGIARAELISNSGQRVATRAGTGGSLKWTVKLKPPAAGRESWYVLKLTQSDGQLAYSSPIWVAVEDSDEPR